MEILHIAVPGAILLVGLAIAVFGWAVKHGQFDDLERQGMNILLDEEPKKKAATDKPAGSEQPSSPDVKNPESKLAARKDSDAEL